MFDQTADFFFYSLLLLTHLRSQHHNFIVLNLALTNTQRHLSTSYNSSWLLIKKFSSLFFRHINLSFWLDSLFSGNWYSECSVMTIQAPKIIQGTKFGTLKKPMFSLSHMIIFSFNGKIKRTIKGTTSSEEYLKQSRPSLE